MERQILRIPISRLDIDKHMVYGYASTDRVDTWDTILEPTWWPQAVTGYLEKRTLSEMHLDLNGEPIRETAHEPMVVGTVPMLEIDDRGLWIGAEITKPDTWERIENGEYNGFSVQVMPFEFREEVVEGKSVVRFTKFHLTDITVGYPAANLDARFQLIERLAQDDSSPWDWDWGKDADAIVDKSGWKGLERACLYKDPDADSETKAAYKLPVAKLKNGELTVYWNGVRAAMAVLLGARGGADIPEKARKTIYNKLKTLYKKFGKEVPKLRLDNGGKTMSKFTEKVVELVQRLTGKAPDETAQKEIDELEKSLGDERTKQIDTLNDTVKGLTERLDKLENPEGDPEKDGAGDNKALEELSGNVKKMEERLGKVETRMAVSKQPGEGDDPGKTTEGGMNEFIRASAKRR